MKINLRELWKRFWEWYNADSEEKAELEEYDEFISLLIKKEDILTEHYAKKKGVFKGDPTKMALLFENARTQKKMSEASKNLTIVTFVLVIATGVLAYATIMTTPNPTRIITDLRTFFLGLGGQ